MLTVFYENIPVIIYKKTNIEYLHITGPYYRYRTFLDMYERDWSSRVDKKSACLRRIRTVPVYVILFLVFGKIFPIDAVKSDEFYASSIWWKMFYMTPVFFVFRMR